MRLLVATPLYPPDPGGPATYAALLAAEFPYPVTVVKFGDVRNYPKVLRHFLYFWNVFRAAKNTDIILALDPVSVGLPTLFAAKLRRKKFVVKVVGDYAWEQGVQRFGITDSLDTFVHRKNVPSRVSFFRRIQTYVAESADRIIVPSEYLKTIVMAWGLPAEKISVAYNAIELEEGGIVPGSIQALPHPRIATIGRLVPWKNISGIIDAVALLETPATLIVIGDGPERSALEKHAQEKLPGRVVFTGALAHADTLATVRESDIFVLNSSYEGFSHVLIEALMIGKPTIATNAGGNGELITHEENGLLIPAPSAELGPKPLADALSRLIADQSLSGRLGEAATAARERFSADTMRIKTAEILDIV